MQKWGLEVHSTLNCSVHRDKWQNARYRLITRYNVLTL